MGLNVKQFKEHKDPLNYRTRRFLSKFIPMWWYSFRNGLRSLWQWKGAVWRYRPWDFNYTLRMLRHSLMLQAKEIEGNARHVGYEIVAKDIRAVVSALDRLIEDDYTHDAYAAHPMGKEIQAEIDEWCASGFSYSLKDNPELDKARRECWETARLAEQTDKDFIFDTIKKEYEQWWD